MNQYFGFNCLKSSITLHPALQCLCLYNKPMKDIRGHRSEWMRIQYVKEKKTLFLGIYIQHNSAVAVVLSFWSQYVEVNEYIRILLQALYYIFLFFLWTQIINRLVNIHFSSAKWKHNLYAYSTIHSRQ